MHGNPNQHFKLSSWLWNWTELNYKCDVFSEIFRNPLDRSIKRTFPAASLCPSFTPSMLFKLCTKDKLSRLTTSMCIYQFNCSCGAKYIGRSLRQLSERVTEHYPPWFIKGEHKVIRSSILEHLVDSEHKISPDSDFRVIYRTSANVPKAVWIRHLAIVEAIAIRLWKPELCIQKKLMHDVSLSWPVWLILSIYLFSCFRFFLVATKNNFFTAFKILLIFIIILVILSVIPNYYSPSHIPIFRCC